MVGIITRWMKRKELGVFVYYSIALPVNGGRIPGSMRPAPALVPLTLYPFQPTSTGDHFQDMRVEI